MSRALYEPLQAHDFAQAIAVGLRLIGIDGGTKTLGLALSDVEWRVATPLETIAKTKFSKDVKLLAQHIADQGVGGLVIGLPVNLDGTEGPRAQATRALARNLFDATQLPILYWDERLTTVAAERALLEADTSRRRRAEVIDKVAASLILQGAMDRIADEAEREAQQNPATSREA